MSNLLTSDKQGDTELFLAPVTVNGKEIPHEQIYAEMQYHPASTPREAAYAAARSLVIGQLLREAAVERGLCEADVEINSEAFDKAVEQLVAGDMDVPAPTEEACRTFFEENRDRFRSEPLAEVRHILLAADPGDEAAREQARSSAADLLRQVQESSDPLVTFADLAKAASECSSSESGGSLGQVSRGDTVAPFEEAVFRQGQGLVPEPVETQYGLHLIYVEHSEPGRPLEFDYVSGRISDFLRERARRANTGAYLQQLVASAEIGGIDLLDGRAA
ncbi:peptidylprolyl isomerase [Microbulbifer yueqingensis]|uniref:peptidylprolyl isomerase n=1 Tax=Microbulbifer yueqingensis TaxID=658219 RepID=A0A1G8XIR6_9GAMM|nr:peptidylprolyl isomerase [Microbulbifer yueqingensis]SDJ90431.1 peptidyl-prolyl cis-trans isomerase C [Microbulbifer yueqingensis]